MVTGDAKMGWFESAIRVVNPTRNREIAWFMLDTDSHPKIDHFSIDTYGFGMFWVSPIWGNLHLWLIGKVDNENSAAYPFQLSFGIGKWIERTFLAPKYGHIGIDTYWPIPILVFGKSNWDSASRLHALIACHALSGSVKELTIGFRLQNMAWECMGSNVSIRAETTQMLCHFFSNTDALICLTNAVSIFSNILFTIQYFWGTQCSQWLAPNPTAKLPSISVMTMVGAEQDSGILLSR